MMQKQWWATFLVPEPTQGSGTKLEVYSLYSSSHIFIVGEMPFLLKNILDEAVKMILLNLDIWYTSLIF